MMGPIYMIKHRIHNDLNIADYLNASVARLPQRKALIQGQYAQEKSSSGFYLVV